MSIIASAVGQILCTRSVKMIEDFFFESYKVIRKGIKKVLKRSMNKGYETKKIRHKVSNEC